LISAMAEKRINLVVEGYPDAQAATKILRYLNFSTETVFNRRGKSRIDEKLAGFNSAARSTGAYWFVLRDMDTDADCAPDLRAKLLPAPAASMCFRVVVRAIESWLLADRETMAAFLAVALAKITGWPEALPNPKQYLIALARTSRRKEICEGMVPREGSGAKEGPEYASLLGQFVDQNWRPEIAAKNSDSLSRCLRSLRAWK